MKTLSLITFVSLCCIACADETTKQAPIKKFSAAEICIVDRENLKSQNAALIGEVAKLRKQINDAQGGDTVRALLKSKGIDPNRFQGVDAEGNVKLTPESPKVPKVDFKPGKTDAKK